MNKMQEQVAEFHKEFGVSVNDAPTPLSINDFLLRRRLMREELAEWEEAVTSDIDTGTIGHQAYKELCDLLYVVFGTALAMGFDAEVVFDEVHRSNMSKRWADGTVHTDAGGKVIKPPTYSPADIESVLDFTYENR